MVIRWGRHGRFYACSGYPECKNTRPIETAEAVVTDQPCDKCGSPMVVKNGRFGRFLACSRYPECKNTRPISTGMQCPLDGGDIIERKTKKGKPFWSCGNYPSCSFASWHRPVKEQCPKCGAPLLFEKVSRNGQRHLYCQNKICGYKTQ